MNLTLTIDGKLLQRAREVARSMGMSLNKLIRNYLEEISSTREPEQYVEELRRLTAEGGGRSGGWSFDREESHERT